MSDEEQPAGTICRVPPVQIYTAKWCTAWKSLEKDVGHLLEHLEIIDVDEDPSRADAAMVSVLPTFVAVRADGVRVVKVGALGVKGLESLVASVL